MSLAAELIATNDDLQRTAPPEIFSLFDSTNRSFISTFDASKTIQPGDLLPKFKLLSATGQEIFSDSLLARGPLLISFDRGGWCPFCNIVLRSLQKHLPKFHAAGVELVAILPEMPDQSLSRTQKMGLEFQLLSDVDNELARKMGLVTPQPESMRPVLEHIESDWKTRESMEVPVPATLLVDSSGTVRKTFINPNYQKRLEPTVALKWIKELRMENPDKVQEYFKDGSGHGMPGSQGNDVPQKAHSGCRFKANGISGSQGNDVPQKAHSGCRFKESKKENVGEAREHSRDGPGHAIPGSQGEEVPEKPHSGCRFKVKPLAESQGEKVPEKPHSGCRFKVKAVAEGLEITP